MCIHSKGHLTARQGLDKQIGAGERRNVGIGLDYYSLSAGGRHAGYLVWKVEEEVVGAE